ncbi:MAG TPA: putative 2OG-Fe(II) oxygenase [Allosphingosinicella sp.]
MTDEDPAARPDGRTIAEALRRLLSGDSKSGLELYDSYLAEPDLPMAPIGLHALFLERAGEVDAARRLLQAGVARGKNVAVKAGGFGADPEEAVREYEGLFARGLVNATMVHEYALALTRAGRLDDVARLFDPERLLRAVHLEPGDLADAAERLLFAEERRGVWQEKVQSVRNMTFVRKVQAMADARPLLAAFERESAAYLDAWAGSDHPLAPLVPRAFEIQAWGLISRGEGYNERHVHRVGWATGVYYPAGVEADGDRGALRVGPPESVEAGTKAWPAATIRPEKGLLVLMPSFYTHWTEPLGRPGLRLSVAFDLLPRRA